VAAAAGCIIYLPSSQFTILIAFVAVPASDTEVDVFDVSRSCIGQNLLGAVNTVYRCCE